MNPRKSQRPTKIITNKHTFAIDQKDHKATIQADLPFEFEFYGVMYKTLIISPLGSIQLVTGDASNGTVASILVYLNTSKGLEDVLHCILTYGSSSVETDDFVVKWNNSFEAVLHQDGQIDFKYFNVKKE
jgi:hypothetical protein